MRQHIREQLTTVVLSAPIKNLHAEVTWTEVERCFATFDPHFTRVDLDGGRTYVLTCATGFDALILQSHLRRLAQFISDDVEITLVGESTL